MHGMFKILQKAANAIVVLIQKVVITISLFCIYFICFGMIFLFCLIFKRKVICGASGDSSTFWVPAEDYETGIDEAARQS
jgi:hypothetical protein